MTQPEQGVAWCCLRLVHTWLPLHSEGWHQHENGGGWVQDTAYVGPLCFVGQKAVVHQTAKVRGRVRLFDQSQIGGAARVGGDTMLRDKAMVMGDALVKGGVVVAENALVTGKAKVVCNAMIMGYAVVTGTARLRRDEVLYDRMYLDQEKWSDRDY